MIYILVTLAFLLGVGYHVMQVVMRLRKKFPEFGFRTIIGTFLQQEWDSLLRSLLVLATTWMWLFISRTTHIKLPVWYYQWGVYALALVLGYAGQRLAYKYLATAEKILEKKSELNSVG